MTEVFADISISLDGFVAGASPTRENPLGDGGERLHEWAVRLSSFRERHGMEGGERDPDDELLAASIARTGAVIMGRRMFSGGDGPWEDDPNADGWWGDEPPFRCPVFVLTHHPRAAVVKQGGTSFTFVTEGAEAAFAQARAAAGDKDVAVGGGASVIQQFLRLGILDELRIHIAPVLLGSGTRLFEPLGSEPLSLAVTRVASSPHVTHLVVRKGGAS